MPKLVLDASVAIKWVNPHEHEHHIKYEERSVSADWSAQQVQQQLALIDKLLSVTTSPTGRQELQQARVSLQGSSH